MESGREGDTERQRQTDRQTDRDRQACRQVGIQTDRQTDMQAKQTYRLTDTQRQTDRQTDKQRKMHRTRDKDSEKGKSREEESIRPEILCVLDKHCAGTHFAETEPTIIITNDKCSLVKNNSQAGQRRYQTTKHAISKLEQDPRFHYLYNYVIRS